MASVNSDAVSFLDKVRINDGPDRLDSYFKSLVKHNKRNAINIINDETLQFASLFVLKPSIDKLGLYRGLNQRNRSALEIMELISTKKPLTPQYLSRETEQASFPVLKWMLETGCKDDGLSDEYEKTLDKAAVLLVKRYKDTTILHILAEMIFNRNNTGHFTYDLVWAFFEARDPKSLLMLSQRLLSRRPRDVEMAKRLLSFIPYVGMGANMASTTLCKNCDNWLHENLPFLYYTGESFQSSPTPVPYVICLEAKYLCKAASQDTVKPLQLNDDEQKLVAQLYPLDPASRALLANCSYFLYRQNPAWWKTWLHYPVSQQLVYARSLGGGLV